MKINDLKIERSNKVEAMAAIMQKAETENRTRSQEEVSEWENLRSEVESLDVEIKAVEAQDELNRSLAEEENETVERNIEIPMEKQSTNVEQLRSIIESGAKGEITRSVKADVAEITPKNIATNLSIVGKEPVYQKIGATIMPEFKGTHVFPYQNPTIAQAVAESAAATQNGVNPSQATLNLSRISVWEEYTEEYLQSINEETFNQIIADLEKGLDRKVSSIVYDTARNFATEVAGADLTYNGLTDLEAGAEVDGKFLCNRKTFYDMKKVKVDDGSGMFLARKNGADTGETIDGSEITYSNLFSDGTNEKYVIYGDMSAIKVGYQDKKVVINPYSNDKEGKIRIVLSAMSGAVCVNPLNFVKTPDLDAAA